MLKAKSPTVITAENAFLSAQQLTTLTGTCTIQDRGLTEDGYGGQIEGWVSRFNILCACNFSLRRNVAEEQDDTGDVNTPKEYFFHLPPGTVVTTMSRIIYEGFTFEVKAVRPPVTVEALRELEVILIS